MSAWSPDDAIAMERRHILEGERRVAHQEALARKLAEEGNSQLAASADELLILMRKALVLSRSHLRVL
jgi:hypothetical protein